MARRRAASVVHEVPTDDVERAVVQTGDCDEVAPEREAGTHVEEEAVPFEVRPDGSIAQFAHTHEGVRREMGS